MASSADKGKAAAVCIIHNDAMQLHEPPNYEDVFELPRRVIAIENGLKGIDVSKGWPLEEPFGGAMQMLFCPPSKTRPVAIGSVAAAKRKRTSYTSGPFSEGCAWAQCCSAEAPEVDMSDLLRVHTEEHVAHVTKQCEFAATQNAALYPFSEVGADETPAAEDADGDVYYSPGSLAAMKCAAGGAVEAVRRLFAIDAGTGRAVGRAATTKSSFAIVRPPGHHCCNKPNGFCYFNNTAVAASHARKVLGLQRVAIVDWDYHHGDGQQEVFYQDPSVLTISLHVAISKRGAAFPMCKELDLSFNGSGPGEGYNINIPWPNDRVGAKEYEAAFQSIVLPALKGFDPELILVASGFDAMMGDILAGTQLQADSYHNLTKQLLGLDLPLAVILEGGYGPELLAEAALNVVHALLERPPPARKTASNANAGKKSNSAGPGDGIEVQHLLNATRMRLNGLPPWKGMQRADGKLFFDESPGMIDSSVKAAKQFTEVYVKLIEGAENHSYYTEIAGLRYKRSLLEKAEAFAKDGQISYPEAKELWDDAQDGPGVTFIESRTLSYTMEKFKFTEKAAKFLEPLLRDGKPKSYYKQVDGVKYDRELLDLAEEFAKDGQVSLAEAMELWKAARDGKVVTKIEARTLSYSMQTHKYTIPAQEFLKPILEKCLEERTDRSRSPRRIKRSTSFGQV